MRLALPLLRYARPSRAPVFRYGVALLSTALALIPAWILPNVAESRLAVFAVAVMVSAWYGGWKPGLVATSFALTVIARFSLSGPHDPERHRLALLQLAAFSLTALLICWFNAALRSAQEGLRRSEANFRSLVTNAPYGICRCDSSGKLLDANPALLEMLGYASIFDLVGMHLRVLYMDSAQWFDLADSMRARTSFQRLPADWRCKDGNIKLVRVSGRAVASGGDNVVFELFAEDVTERRALEQQLYHSQKMEAVGRLAGGIAHDFNNLLMVISGYSELLLSQLETQPALRAQAQQVSTAAARAAALTKQLLAFSRKQMLVPKVLDLNAVITENLKMLARLIGEDIHLVMVPGADLSDVKADVGQIEQVIMNLAVNARDAMPTGGKLTIETANVFLDEAYARSHAPLEPGVYVMLKISDTGAGIDPQTLSHIFDPFFTTKGTKGTGLGLSTVYGIVKQSGGYIWVDSEQGKGASFTIYLPRVLETGEPAVASTRVAALPSRKNAETILLVEDESNLRYLARHYLEKHGYTVIEAADGAMALQIAVAREGEIHLLLTDVIMPGMNGRELAGRISEIRPSTRVLYMSGYTENVIGHNGMLDAGVNFLQKPFNLNELSEKVRAVLDSARQEPALTVHVPATPEAAFSSLSPADRAKRFYIQLPLRYRELGEANWHKGTTQNISRSGLLFQAEGSLLPRAELEISLVLPAEIAGLAPAEVVCRGEVVRSIAPQGSTIAPALAARILQYYFQHGPMVSQA